MGCLKYSICLLYTSTLAGHFAHLSIDGWAGAVVAVFILKAGWGAAKDTINPLLGASPDPELVHAIRAVSYTHLDCRP